MAEKIRVDGKLYIPWRVYSDKESGDKFMYIHDAEYDPVKVSFSCGYVAIWPGDYTYALFSPEIMRDLFRKASSVYRSEG